MHNATVEEHVASNESRQTECGRAAFSHAAEGLHEFVHFMKHSQKFADDDKEADVRGYG